MNVVKDQLFCYLSLHVHYDDCVGSITNDVLFHVSWKQMNAVDCDVRAGRATEGLERALAFRTLDVPDLDRTIRTRTGM